MNCKNCGVRLRNNAKVCPNCGAFLDDEDGYVLLTADDKMFDIYADAPDEPEPVKKKRGRGVIWFLSIVLTLLIVSLGAYYYFTNIYNPEPERPTLTFETGSGIINGDEKIIYVTLSEKSSIEYIHGVSLYDYDKADETAQEKAAVSTDYEYTKSIDSTFRTIFFKTDKLDLKEGENTYTFEMKFSFNGSDEVFTYLKPITFSSDINKDVSDIIFDHSQSEQTTASKTNETTTKPDETTTEKTTSAKADNGFIYNSYWFTEPFENGNELYITAIKFNSDKTYVSTNYYKNGDSSWEITTASEKYVIEDGYLVLNNGEATESTYYKIDYDNQSLVEEENGKTVSTLSPRKYNSIKNVEDFFGL